MKVTRGNSGLLRRSGRKGSSSNDETWWHWDGKAWQPPRDWVWNGESWTHPEAPPQTSRATI